MLSPKPNIAGSYAKLKHIVFCCISSIVLSYSPAKRLSPLVVAYCICDIAHSVSFISIVPVSRVGVCQIKGLKRQSSFL